MGDLLKGCVFEGSALPGQQIQTRQGVQRCGCWTVSCLLLVVGHL